MPTRLLKSPRGTPAKYSFGNEIPNSRANRPERPSIISPFANANTTSTNRDAAVSGEDLPAGRQGTAKSDESTEPLKIK